MEQILPSSTHELGTAGRLILERQVGLKLRPGGAMQIAKGLHRIGSDTVNSYLVVGEGGVAIIDAGLTREAAAR
jgi:hypothetical protein